MLEFKLGCYRDGPRAGERTRRKRNRGLGRRLRAEEAERTDVRVPSSRGRRRGAGERALLGCEAEERARGAGPGKGGARAGGLLGRGVGRGEKGKVGHLGWSAGWAELVFLLFWFPFLFYFFSFSISNSNQSKPI